MSRIVSTRLGSRPTGTAQRLLAALQRDGGYDDLHIKVVPMHHRFGDVGDC
jgi:hypothetical protein